MLLARHSTFNVAPQRYSPLRAGLLLAVFIGYRLPWRYRSRTTVRAHGDEDHEAFGRFGKELVSCVPGADGCQDVHAVATGADELGGGFDEVADLDRAENLTLPTYAVML